MVSRPLLRSVVAVLCVVGTLAAQQPKPRNPIEERLKAARLESPEGGDPAKFGQMRNGNINLETPSADQLTILDVKARQLIFPVTHFEYYTATEAVNAELTPRTEDKTVAKLVSDLRAQLVIVSPGDNTIAAPRLHFAREFGAAAVRAIDEVLGKGPQPVVRMNAVRLLAVVAESGAPAATKKVIELLKEKENGLSVEVLYYALKGAEQAIAMYDPARSAEAQKWVTKDTYFALVSVVDDIVQKVPASVALNTYQPDRAGTGTLTTDPKTAPKPAPSTLTAEQVATVQAFRLQAIRALAKVKTDVVIDSQGNNKRRPAYTLARVAVSDTTIVPPPSPREIIEAVGGLATAAPTDPELDPLVLGVVMARGVSDFVTDKAAGGVGEAGPQAQHWKLTGARMKVAFQAWDVSVGKSKLDKDGKTLLRELAQLAITQVFDPLSKQSETGVVNGLRKDALDEWLTKRLQDVKAMQLYKDTDRSGASGTSKLTPR